MHRFGIQSAGGSLKTKTMLLPRLTQSLSFYMRQRCCRQISTCIVKCQDVENAAVG